MTTENFKLSNAAIQNIFTFKNLFLIGFIFVFSSNLFGNPLSVPFELHNNHIYLKTAINNKGTYYFLFDSGAGASGSVIDKSVAETLKLPVKGNVNAGLIGGNRGLAFTEDVKFSIGDLIFDEKKAAFIPLKEQEREEGHQIDGLFGYSLIKNYVIEVDYQKRILTFYPPAEYKKPKRSKVIKLLNIDENKVPVVQGKILTAKKKTLDIEFIIDTGYDENLLFGRKFVEENNLQADVISARISGGSGLGGETSLMKGKIKNLLLENIKSKNPETIFAFDKEGNFSGKNGFIGGKFLKKYKLVLNYKENYILLL